MYRCMIPKPVYYFRLLANIHYENPPENKDTNRLALKRIRLQASDSIFDIIGNCVIVYESFRRTQGKY